MDAFLGFIGFIAVVGCMILLRLLIGKFNADRIESYAWSQGWRLL